MKLSNEQTKKYMEMAVEEMKLSVSEKRSDNKAVPKVGAVLVWPNGESNVITCAHRGELRNGDHAEYTLLDRKLRDKDLTGAVLFATLEPCAPGSRQPPKCSCSERIANARISKVYFGIEDPDPTVAGRGMNYLSENGVEVQIFPKELQDIIKEENSAFLKQATERAQIAKETVNSPVDSLASSLEDLSDEALDVYGKSLGLNRQSIMEHLIDLGLLSKNVNGSLSPKKECLILFGKDPGVKCKGAYIVIKRKGKTASGDAIKYIRRPMVLAVEDIEAWYKESLPDQTYDTTMKRSINQQTRFHVFREAVVNAIMHRDYSIEGSCITITVWEDMIEIKSPGAPPAPISIDQLNSFNAPALSRNPSIAFVFRELKYSENYGHGLDLMREMQSVGLPYPHYSYDGVNLILSIPLSKEALTTIFPETNELTSEELAIIEYIREIGMATKGMVASQFSVNEKTAQRRLSLLAEKGFITGNGEAKTSKKYGYVISKKLS